MRSRCSCQIAIVAAATVTTTQTAPLRYSSRCDREADNLAIVLAAQTERSFQAVDLVMREVAAGVAAAGIEDAAGLRARMGAIETHQLLVDRLHSLPQADGLSLVDDRGVVVNMARTWPTPRVDTSDRDYFAYWRDHADTGVFIGAPIVNRITGRWILTMTRRLNGPRGQFVGMTGFGASAPGEALYEHYGITPQRVAEAARSLL